MDDRALALFIEAWNKIKRGMFFDSEVNQQFDYMSKTIWKIPELKNKVQKDVLTSLPKLFEQAKLQDKLPPFIFILISLNDRSINIRIQELLIANWLKANASEASTFELLNIIDTFTDKNIDTSNFIHTAIKYINNHMDKEMVQAFAYMIVSQHPEFLETILKKLYSLNDKSILKDFTRMVGKKAMLSLMQFLKPNEVQKLLR